MLKYEEMEMIVMDMLTGSKVRVVGPDADEFISQFQADIDLAEKNGWNIEIPHDIQDISTDSDSTKKRIRVIKGGPGSGHFGHEGRPGSVGGSKPGQLSFSGGKWDTFEALSEGGNAIERRGFNAETANTFWSYLETYNKLKVRHGEYGEDGLSREAFINMIAKVTGLEGDEEAIDTANLLYDAFEYGDDATGLRAEIQIIRIGYGDDFTIEGKITHVISGDAVGYFRRDFTLSDEDGSSIVKHDFFRLNAEYQNQGFGSRFYENSEIAYMNAGLDAIYLEADMAIGGYAWARMGFDFRDDFTLNNYKDQFKDRLTWMYSTEVALDRYEIDWASWDANTNHAWDIAAYEGPDGRRVGKEFLLGKSYEAVKILSPFSMGVEIGDAYYEIKKRMKKSER